MSSIGFTDGRIAWKVVHLATDAPATGAPGTGATAAGAARAPAEGRLEVTWRGGFPVGGAVVPPDGGARRPHPVAPRGAAPTPRPAKAPAPARARLSVVVPTRDRPEDLGRCLASLAGQTRRPDQIVVVDNAPREDRTRQAALRAGAAYVREDRPGLDFARNAGVAAADGDIIAFCDDDVVLHPDWCRQILVAFGDGPEVDAVTGLVLPLELATPAQRVFEFRWSFGRGFERIDYGPEFFARTVAHGCPAWIVGAGASMAFRRQVFERLGLFDERLDAGASGCSGDSELWYRILATGGTCRYEPRIVSHHRHRPAMEDLRRQIRAYMRGHVVALLVQHQRHGHRGNLRRAFLAMPGGYLRRLLRRLRRRPEGDLVWDELAGFLGGFRYFAGHRRLETRYPPARPRGAPPAAAAEPAS